MTDMQRPGLGSAGQAAREQVGALQARQLAGLDEPAPTVEERDR